VPEVSPFDSGVRSHEMASATLPPSPIGSLRTVELTDEWESTLQRFFDENPIYFLSVNGEPAHPGEAHEEIHGELPTGWPFTKKWLVGYLDAENNLAAMANVVSDLLAPTVWHIGLFIIATERQGNGEAQTLYHGLEAWAVANGARWLRLGVVHGNERAERFWERLGYQQVRTRDGIAMCRLTNTVRVMVKALTGQPLEKYLALVERDRAEGARAA
jgi:ribosomal protein S18 acetylase RimI-like enzyme